MHDLAAAGGDVGGTKAQVPADKSEIGNGSVDLTPVCDRTKFIGSKVFTQIGARVAMVGIIYVIYNMCTGPCTAVGYKKCHFYFYDNVVSFADVF